MIHKAIGLAAAVMLAWLPVAASADDDFTVFGGDTYASGQTTTLDVESPRNAFVTGFTATIDAPVTRDAHIAGGHVSVDAPIGGDLYAAGFWISVDAPVGGDLTASGYTVSLDKNVTIGGNTRIAARSVEIDGALSGSLLAVAQKVTINGTVSGDLMLGIDRLSFGPDAKIDGNLVYVGPRTFDIPASVIDPDRVTHKEILGDGLSMLGQLTIAGEALHEFRADGGVRTAAEIAAAKKAAELTAGAVTSHRHVTVWTLLAGFLVALAVHLIIAALFLRFAPERTEFSRARFQARPFASLGYGFLAFSMLIGAIPVAAVTVIGLVLVPFLILLVVIACFIAHLLAVYVLAWWALNAIKPVAPSFLNRLLATAVGFTLFSLLHYVPFAGWIANIAIMLAGLGAIAVLCAQTMLDRRERRLRAVIATPPSDDEDDGAVPEDGQPQN